MQELPELIPAAPVREWIACLGVPVYRLAIDLGDRTGRSVNAWRRWMTRLPHQQHVSVWIVDELCTALGAHLSRFDPAYG